MHISKVVMVKTTNIEILFLLYFLASSIAFVYSIKDNLKEMTLK